MTMTNLESLIPWVPVLVILSYLPFLIRADILYREIDYSTWIGMLPMIPATGYLFAVGYYPAEMIGVSLGSIVLYFIAMKKHWIEGADFTFLAFISIIFVVNPLSGRILMPLVVMEFLLAVFVSVNLVALALRKKIEHFPMIPVIGAAFILAVLLG